MGSGIAMVAARAGLKTILFDVNAAMLEKSRLNIYSSFKAMVEKGRLAMDEYHAITARLLFTGTVTDCVADIIIEAVIEDKTAKTALFSQLAGINRPDTIFATNTSSISVTAIAESIEGPARLAGMHFFNPAPVMQLLEVVKTKYTAEDVIETVTALAKQMGKVPVICSDSPGFIVNRVARNYYLEALKLVEAGLAGIETVDAIMEATGFKMGPFRLMDLIGLDVNYAVSNIVWEALDKPERLMPSPLQKAKVNNGELGKKSGTGFYTYAPKGG
jgi:3-hydroxybutyryl-CoA dehydrogenase